MNIVAYVRYSSDNQREESLDAQIRAIKDFCIREGYTLVKIFSDEAKTATSDKRPGFLNMMREAESGTFSAVIVHKLDRFSRDRFDSAFYKRHLSKNGVRLISVLENLDNSPESIILESVLEGMAEYYSRNLSREVMKGMRETAYQCRHTGGIPPLGYDIDLEKKYVINAREAEAVKIMFNMFADGLGYTAIIEELNSKGFRTKIGNTFGKNSIHDLLKNEKYIGVFVFNRAAKMVNGKRNSHRLKPEEEIIRIPGGCPAIIEMELWERVHERMNNNKKKSGSYSSKTVYLLSGRIFCGKCGGSMSGNKANTRKGTDYSYYKCSNKKKDHSCDANNISKSFVEEKVIDALYDNLFGEHVIDMAADMIHKHATVHKKEIPSHVKSYEKELHKVEIEINNIVNAVAAGLYHESMKGKLDDLEASKSALKIRLEEAKFQEFSHSLTRNQIYAFLLRYQNIKDLPPEEQKKVIEMFVDKVIVHDNSIDIEVLTVPENNPEKKKTSFSRDEESLKFEAYPIVGLTSNFGDSMVEVRGRTIPAFLAGTDYITNLLHIKLSSVLWKLYI